MVDINQAVENQLKNIQSRTGKSLAELNELYRASGLSKHGEVRDMFKQSLGLGHGDAHMLTAYLLNAGGDLSGRVESVDPQEALAQIYSGAKAGLRPIHEAVMARVRTLGEFEIAPKKTYLSLRRARQFAMLGPATNTQVELGLNMKGVEPGGRLQALPPGGMCQYRVRLSSAAEVDDELAGWLKTAYDSAG